MLNLLLPGLNLQLQRLKRFVPKRLTLEAFESLGDGYYIVAPTEIHTVAYTVIDGVTTVYPGNSNVSWEAVVGSYFGPLCGTAYDIV